MGFSVGTRRQASALELAGHALNLPDGRAQVLASGEASAIDALERWLQQGPAHARVDQVERRELPLRQLDGFVCG